MTAETARTIIWKERTDNLVKWMEPRKIQSPVRWITGLLGRCFIATGWSGQNQDKPEKMEDRHSYLQIASVEKNRQLLLCQFTLCHSTCTMEELVLGGPNDLDGSHHLPKTSQSVIISTMVLPRQRKKDYIEIVFLFLF